MLQLSTGVPPPLPRPWWRCRECHRAVGTGGLGASGSDKSRRTSYTHYLGRPLRPNNAGAMQWGTAYRDLHERAWAEVARVLQPGGVFILNVSDHVRKGVVAPVSAWHVDAVIASGLDLDDLRRVPTPRMRWGANRNVRVEYEYVLLFRKGAPGALAAPQPQAVDP